MASFEEKYRGRPVLVTGSSRGIGLAVAGMLHEVGAEVIGCARRPTGLSPFPEYVVDVGNARDVGDLAGHVRRAHGALDLVVHCAGVLGPRKPLVDVDVVAFDSVIQTNLTGTFLVAKHMHPLLALGRRPLLAMLSSSVGRRGRAGWGPYAVSKHGVEGLNTTLAEEWLDDEIGVWSINPGGTATDMRAEAMPGEDPKTLPSAESVAAVILGRCAGFELRASGESWDVRDFAG